MYKRTYVTIINDYTTITHNVGVWLNFYNYVILRNQTFILLFNMNNFVHSKSFVVLCF